MQIAQQLTLIIAKRVKRPVLIKNIFQRQNHTCFLSQLNLMKIFNIIYGLQLWEGHTVCIILSETEASENYQTIGVSNLKDKLAPIF